MVIKEYLYSPCGPYGLYRASVPVHGIKKIVKLGATALNGRETSLGLFIKDRC
jgi:hypothetical protein